MYFSLGRVDQAAFLSVSAKEFFQLILSNHRPFTGGEDSYVIFIAKITLVIPQACFDFHQEESATML